LNIRIRGKACIEKKLTLGQRVKFLIEGDMVREETEDNQDGSVNICYIIHPMSVEDTNAPNPSQERQPKRSITSKDIDEY
jgi:hypothetical protein